MLAAVYILNQDLSNIFSANCVTVRCSYVICLIKKFLLRMLKKLSCFLMRVVQVIDLRNKEPWFLEETSFSHENCKTCFTCTSNVCIICYLLLLLIL